MKELKLDVRHDWISLKTPNGNFTVSRNGVKATGQLAVHFDAINKRFKQLLEGSTTGEAMAKLATPEEMNVLFPDWNKVVLFELAIGDKAKIIDEYYAAKYPEVGVITKIDRKNCSIKFPSQSGNISFPKSYIGEA